MKFDVITIGGITEDIMFHAKDLKIIRNPNKIGSDELFAFPAGEKILSDEKVLYTMGGGGANAAVGLSKLGLKAALVGAIGTDPSALKIRSELKKKNVNLSLVQVISHYWTGLSFVITAGRRSDHVIFTHRAANEQLRLSYPKLRRLKGRWHYLTSLSGPFWQENLDVVFKVAKKKRIKVAWNPGSAQLKKGARFLKPYLKETEVLILNREEAMELVKSAGSPRSRSSPRWRAGAAGGAAGKKTSNIEKLLTILESLGPRIVSISDGPRGAYVYDGLRPIFEKALPFPAVNTTGAGDAFGSSLIGGLIIYQGDLKRALKLAMIRSNYVVRKIGAQVGLLTLKEAEEAMEIRGQGTGSSN